MQNQMFCDVYMKEQGALEQLMEPIQLEMFNSSSTKEEFATKLATLLQRRDKRSP